MYHTVKAVAVACNVSIYAVYKAHERGSLAEPKIRVGHTRVYIDQELDRAKVYFGRHQKQKQDVLSITS